MRWTPATTACRRPGVTRPPRPPDPHPPQQRRQSGAAARIAAGRSPDSDGPAHRRGPAGPPAGARLLGPHREGIRLPVGPAAGRPAGRPPAGPLRVNQDRSRGCNYTSNRGGHATFNGSARLDTSGTRPFVEAVCDAYSRCGHVYLTVACILPLAGFPEMATSIAGGASISRQCYPRCQEHQVFPRPAATVSQARWRDGNNFRGGATNRNLSREDYGRTISRPPSSRT